MRRAAPKTGRNDPCPCGSGRKYKKCCAEKDAARLADPSPVAGVTMSEYREQPEQYLDTSKFYELGVQEVARLDYSRLSTPCVIQAVRRLSHYRFWTEAEKAMEVLTIRTDLPSECRVDGYRAELINEALEARVRDVVQRQVALVTDTGVLDNIHLELELLTPDADTLSHLEEEAVEGMREAEGSRFLDLVYSLLDQFPALGILVARGALITDRPLDMEFLLERVERARDRLQLSPGDLAQDLYECLIDRELANQADEDQTGDWNLADEASPATTSAQRKLLKETSAKVASLEKRLREQEELLRKATAERKQMPAPQQPAKIPASMPFESEELKRLRAKVAELKGLISESHKERSGLRVQLADAMRKAEETALQPTRQQGQVLPAAQYVAEDTEELDAGMPGRWHMLVPTFRNAAREEIRSAPAPLARQALQAAAGLAAGDRSAWSGIKRLRRVSDVWSARIGLHHRLLFRLDAGRGSLEITAFIHRRDLESVIARGNL
jgi:mRNA-degrading endonuclease RelE of RelBE toxin-antitoxin system